MSLIKKAIGAVYYGMLNSSKNRAKRRKYMADYRPTLAPIKVTHCEYDLIRSIFQKLKLEVIDAINSISDEEKVIGKPTSPFPFSDTVRLSKNGDYLGIALSRGGVIYRMIRESAVEEFTRIWQTGILQCFSKLGFVPPIRISHYYLEDYPIVLEVDDVSPVVNPRNCSRIGTTRDISVFIGFLCDICNEVGVPILDPHCYNFGISNGHFYYFDIGSFSIDSKHHRQYSLVVSCLDRLLFSFFPSSLLSSLEIKPLRTPREDIEEPIRVEYSDEYQMYLNRYLRFHRRNSSNLIYKIARDVFIRYHCKPENLICLFYDKRYFTEDFIRKLVQM